MAEHSETVLDGSECSVCGTIAFPVGTHCARCATPTAQARQLSNTGTVWSYTVQRFAPKSPPYVPPPEGFSPFAVGYVELPEGIRIGAILDCETFDDLIDCRAELIETSPVPRFHVYPHTAGVPAETERSSR